MSEIITKEDLEAATWRDNQGNIIDFQTALKQQMERWHCTEERAVYQLSKQYQVKQALPEAEKIIREKESMLEELHGLLERQDGKGNPIIPEPSDFAEIFNHYFRFGKIIDTGKLLVQINRKYGTGGRELVRGYIEKIYPKSTNNIKREVVDKLGDLNSFDRSEFDPDPYVLNLKNCYFHLGAMDKYAGTEYKSLKQLEVKYRPELGDSEKFKTFLEEIMPDKTTRDGLLECCAMMLLRDIVPFTKYVILQGSGANGKSTLLKVLKSILGQECVENVSWQQLEHNRFAPAKLEGVYANIFYDLPANALKSTSNIKSLVDQEPIFVEKKGIDGYSMTYTGRIYFSCNTLPELPELEKADLRRIFLFRFMEVFESDGQNLNLIAELTSETEKSRIFNTLLKEAHKILERGHIAYTQKEREIETLWRLHSSSSLQFIEQKLTRAIPGKAEKIPTVTIYTKYVQFCTEHKLKPQSSRTLNAMMETQGFERRDTTVNGKKTTYWINLSLDQAETQSKL